jgi:hypothetical protein
MQRPRWRMLPLPALLLCVAPALALLRQEKTALAGYSHCLKGLAPLAPACIAALSAAFRLCNLSFFDTPGKSGKTGNKIGMLLINMPLERWNVATILPLSPLPCKIPLRFTARLAPVLQRSATGAARRCSVWQSASVKAWLSKPARVRARVLAGKLHSRDAWQTDNRKIRRAHSGTIPSKECLVKSGEDQYASQQKPWRVMV